MRNRFEWAIEGIFRKSDGCLDSELYRNEDVEHLLFRATEIETQHPEYLCVNMLLICETGDEDIDAEFGRAYIKRWDRKWVLPKNFTFAGYHQGEELKVPELYHKRFAEVFN
jgi:hypothetical protein